MTPSTPASPARLSLTVSYPEKFHLAVKYAAEGPPLPNLSDADRILLDALQQQATVGECNRPRPGMWDSAEEKAKYEAWKKLGSMSRAEAMHLYVQAIEVFDERWLEWPGLQPGAATPTPAPTPNGVRGGAGANGSGHPMTPKLSIASAVAAMRQLRTAGVAALPPSQQQALRAECDSLIRALDAARTGGGSTR